MDVCFNLLVLFVLFFFPFVFFFFSARRFRVKGEMLSGFLNFLRFPLSSAARCFELIKKLFIYKFLYADTGKYVHTHTHTHTHANFILFSHIQNCLFFCTSVHVSFARTKTTCHNCLCLFTLHTNEIFNGPMTDCYRWWINEDRGGYSQHK